MNKRQRKKFIKKFLRPIGPDVKLLFDYQLRALEAGRNLKGNQIMIDIETSPAAIVTIYRNWLKHSVFHVENGKLVLKEKYEKDQAI